MVAVAALITVAPRNGAQRHRRQDVTRPLETYTTLQAYVQHSTNRSSLGLFYGLGGPTNNTDYQVLVLLHLYLQ